MAVKSKEPNVEADWPPYGGTAKQVGPADNWWTLQKEAGRGNVWDVIYFNFRTADSAEVNWYMENYLGCNVLSGNRKSYKFGTRVKKTQVDPVTVYLPPKGWTPPYDAKLPAPPARPPMAAADADLAAFVRSVLYSNALGWVDFTLGPLTLSYIDYRRVADWIRYGVIAVYAVAPDSPKAGYDPDENALYLRDQRDIDGQAMIVHEATHAVCDMKRVANILTVDDECAGYLAGYIFAQKKMNADRRLQVFGAGIDLPAFELYQKYAAGERLTYASFAPLRAAIRAHPDYNTTADDAAAYDGIFHG